MRKNQKGFSLVELIVTIAILALVSLGVAGFLSVSLKSFRKVSNEVDLQYEAQLTFNQIKDVLIDASVAVLYDDASKSLTIYNSDYNYVISYVDADSKLYLTRNSLKADGSVDSAGSPSLMAENVTGFSATLPSDRGNVVVVNMSFATSADRTYSASQNYTLRNFIYTITDASKLAELYSEVPTYASVTGLALYLDGTNTENLATPNETRVLLENETTTVSLSHKVEGSTNPLPSQDVTWELVGYSGTASSVDAYGNVTIGYDETCDTISVLCKSVQDTSIGKSFTIDINKITGIVLSAETQLVNGKVVPGSTIKLSATFTGIGDMSKLSGADTSITWKDAANKTLGQTQNGMYTYTAKNTDAGKTVIISAHYKGGDKVTGSYSFNVDKLNYGIRIVTDDSSNSSTVTLKRGSTGVNLKAQVYDLTSGQTVSYDGSKIAWEFSDMDSTVASTGYISLSSYTGASTTLKCSTSLAAETNPTFKVKAYLTENSDISASRSCKVDKISIQYYTYDGQAAIAADALNITMFSSVKRVPYVVKFELLGLEDSEICFDKQATEDSSGSFYAAIDNSNDLITFTNKNNNKGDGKFKIYYVIGEHKYGPISTIPVTSAMPTDTLNTALNYSNSNQLTNQKYGYSSYYNAYYDRSYNDVVVKFYSNNGESLATYYFYKYNGTWYRKQN